MNDDDPAAAHLHFCCSLSAPAAAALCTVMDPANGVPQGTALMLHSGAYLLHKSDFKGMIKKF